MGNTYELRLDGGTGYIRHEIRYKNRPLIIDTRAIDGGLFETAAIRKNGEELAMVRSSSPAVAARIHENVLRSFLPADLLKLSDDLAACVAQSYEENRNHEDGGTCNFDAPVIHLPGGHAGTIDAAASLVGESCFEWQKKKRDPFYNFFVFSGPLGQGNRRTAMAERISELMESRGYHTGVYYQMD